MCASMSRLRLGFLLPLAFLLAGAPPHPAAAQEWPLQGTWTGGFMLREAWVAVNLRVAAPGDSAGDTADLLFPSYGGAENAINVAVEALNQTPNSVHFEVPAARNQRVVFDGRADDASITGKFVHGQTTGTFGLTRWTRLPLDSLEKYYGAYRVSPDRVISILRGWGTPRSLNFVDYKTGEVGTLWPSSGREFYAGVGLFVSFPVALRVSFDQESAGNVTTLSWQPRNAARFTARKLDFKEERLTCQNGDVILGGTLILPEGASRHPVVIIVPGDFGTNRNQLRLWAHDYASRGIAALVFDSRGAGESTGRVGLNTFSDMADDVLAWVKTLRARDDVRPDAVGLFGFSNSAWTVSLASSRSAGVAFLILQSLPGVVPWKQDIFRAETQLRVDGFSETEVKQGADFTRRKFEVARTGQGWEEIESIMRTEPRWLPYTNPPSSLERSRQSYESVMTYDPVPALEKLRIPILALWGAKDTYVPVPETVTIFKRAMAKAGNRAYTAKIFPGCTHSLLVDTTGSPSTGGTERNFAPGLWKMEADWVLKHVARSGRFK
jgi:dienelactone hydrolase